MPTTTEALLAEGQAVLLAVQELHVLGSDEVPPVVSLVYVGSEALGGYGATREEAYADLRRTVALWVTTPLRLAESTRQLLAAQREGS